MRMRVPLLAVLVGVLGGGCGTSSTVQSSVVDFDKAFDDSLVVLTTDLPPAVVGKEYRFRLQATGQPQPFLWALVSGHLPKGLSLDGDGGISGVPTAHENASFVVKVHCKAGPTPDRAGSKPHVGLRMRYFTLVVQSPAAAAGGKS